MKLDVEVTKSPRGNLQANAEVSGWYTLINDKKKPEELEKISIGVEERWERTVTFANGTSQDGVGGKKYDEQVYFEKSSKAKKVVFNPGDKKRWEFKLKLPSAWPSAGYTRDSTARNWRMSIVAYAMRGRIRGEHLEVVAPVDGSKMKPMWFFKEEAGAKGAGGSGAMFERPSSVGAFSVIPKGQKATLQLSRGDEEGEFRVSFQTPGVVRGSNEFAQKVDVELLGRMMGKLEKVASALNVVRGLDANDPTRAKTEKAHESLRKVGNALYNQMIPAAVQTAMKGITIAMDFGLDESVLSYPWELMHDGTDFLCLKVPLGRYVSSGNSASSMTFVEREKGIGVKFLLIVDPDGSLPGARKEGAAIKEELSAIDGVQIKMLVGDEADTVEVLSELGAGYDFIHYSGHAMFDAENPENSGILLADGLLKAFSLAGAVKNKPPILAFLNACESGRQADWGKGETRYENQVSGLSAAFLINGINFIGPYFPVYDDAALMFSKNFYLAVLGGTPLGEAVRKSKKLIFDTFKGEEIAWASYSFWGDPTQTLEFEK